MIKRVYKNNRDSIHYFLVVIIQSGLQIIIIPFITAILSTEQYSELSLANNIFGVAVIITHFGFLNTYSVLFYQVDTQWKLTYNIIISYAINVIVVSVLSLCIYQIIDIKILDTYYLFYILIAILAEVYFEVYRTTLRLELKSMNYLVVMFIKLATSNLLFLYLLYYHDMDGRSKFIGLFIMIFIMLLPIYFKHRKDFDSSYFDRGLIKQIIRRSSLIAPGQITKSIQNTFDIFVVFYLIGKSEFALFAIAVQLSRPLERFSASLMDSYIPRLYKNLSVGDLLNKEDGLNRLKYILLVGIVAVAVILFGPLIFELLVKNPYLKEAIIIFPFLIAGRFVFSLAQYHESVIIYHGKNLYSSIVNLLNIFTMLGLFYFLFDRFDLIGIGYAFISVKLIHYLFLISGYYVFNIKRHIFWDNISIIILIAIVMIYQL